jgi:hypothetical protein
VRQRRLAGKIEPILRQKRRLPARTMREEENREVAGRGVPK